MFILHNCISVTFLLCLTLFMSRTKYFVKKKPTSALRGNPEYNNIIIYLPSLYSSSQQLISFESQKLQTVNEENKRYFPHKLN
jgi:hypothetical protein